MIRFAALAACIPLAALAAVEEPPAEWARAVPDEPGLENLYRIVVQGWSKEAAIEGLVDHVRELDVEALKAEVGRADCEAIDGLESLLKPGKVLLLGELHGTVEMPAFTLDVACHAAAAGLPVVVALELLPSAADSVEAFLESPGEPADRRRFLSGPQWQRSYQDGRTSRAMVDLLAGLGRLRREGHPVRVALFDAQPAGGGQARERAMAANLAASVEAHPKAMHIVLTGDAHSRTTKGGRSGADYEPMGYLLSRKVGAKRVTALKARSSAAVPSSRARSRLAKRRARPATTAGTASGRSRPRPPRQVSTRSSWPSGTTPRSVRHRSRTPAFPNRPPS